MIDSLVLYEKALDSIKNLPRESRETVENQAPLFLGPYFSQHASSIHPSLVRNARYMDRESLQRLLFFCEAVVHHIFPENLDDMPYQQMIDDPLSTWLSNYRSDQPVIGIAGKNQPTQVHVSLILEFLQPDRDPQKELIYLLRQVNQYPQSDFARANPGLLLQEDQILFLECTFDKAMDSTKMMWEYPDVTKGPLEFMGHDSFNRDYLITCTLIARVHMLQRLADQVNPDTDLYDGGIPYRAHVFMQQHCPLFNLIYDLWMEEPGREWDLNILTTDVDNLPYPTMEKCIWAPLLYDLSNLLEESGFFGKQLPQQLHAQKRDSKKVSDGISKMIEEGIVDKEGLDKVMSGFKTWGMRLAYLLQKNLPIRCQVRHMLFILESLAEKDPSVYDIVMRMFYISIMGGYPSCSHRPSFISLHALYQDFLLRPPDRQTMFQWLSCSRKNQTSEFSPPSFDQWPFVMPQCGKTSQKRTQKDGTITGKGEVVSHQRMLMFCIKEALEHMLKFVPGLRKVVSEAYYLEESESCVRITMNRMRRTLEYGIMMRHQAALQKIQDQPDLSFKQALQQTGPFDPFHATLCMILHNRRYNNYAFYRPKTSFEQALVAACDHIDASRRIPLEKKNLGNSCTPEEEAIAEKWGFQGMIRRRNKRSVQYQYLCDHLEENDSGMKSLLRIMVTLLNKLMVPVERPVLDKILICFQVDRFAVRSILEMRNNHRLRSIEKSLLSFLDQMNPVTYTVVRFMYSYIVNRRLIKTYYLPQSVYERQKACLRKKFHLKPHQEVTDSMSSVLLCPGCKTIKCYLANRARNVTAFGNRNSRIDPFNMQVYCGEKVRKQSNAREKRVIAQLSTLCQEQKNMANTRARLDKEQDQGSDSEDEPLDESSQHSSISAQDHTPEPTQRAVHTNNKTIRNYMQAQVKNYVKDLQQQRCTRTLLVRVPLLGRLLIFNDQSYTLCPECATPMMVTPSSFQGMFFHCGNCADFVDNFHQLTCAYCMESTSSEVQQQAEQTRDSSEKERYQWSKFMVYNDTELYNSNPGVRRKIKNVVGKPYIMPGYEKIRGHSNAFVIVCMCPEHARKTRELQESKKNVMLWSDVYLYINEARWIKKTMSGDVVMAGSYRRRISGLLRKSGHKTKN